MFNQSRYSKKAMETLAASFDRYSLAYWLTVYGIDAVKAQEIDAYFLKHGVNATAEYYSAITVTLCQAFEGYYEVMANC